MKCRKCQNRAAINMRQHKLALCNQHYIEWFQNQTERAIKKYHMFGKDANLLVAVSGGKDSLALWDVLDSCGYQTTGIYLQLGITELNYSIDSGKTVEKFARQRGLNLMVVDVPNEYGATIPEMAAKKQWHRDKPCAVCGTVKRYLMNKTAADSGFDVLVTGHNLDDEAAVLLGNTLHWSKELLLRQAPVLEAEPGFVRKTKPLCRFYERETAAYALIRGINYITEECPYSVGSTLLLYKDLLNRLEDEKPGSKQTFYLSFINASKNGFLEPQTQDESSFNLIPCKKCGQLTSAKEYCAFCRLVEVNCEEEK